MVVEEATAAMFEPAEGFDVLERRDYGETELIFLRFYASVPARAASDSGDDRGGG